MTVTAGVASIKGTYSGSCVLTDLNPHESLVMKLDGAGAPGTIGATVNVRFAPGEGETTTIAYDADAIVGGMIGGVGQRMLTSVSRRMAGEFFGNVDKALSRRPARGSSRGRRGSGRGSGDARERTGVHRAGEGGGRGLPAGLPHRCRRRCRPGRAGRGARGPIRPSPGLSADEPVGRPRPHATRRPQSGPVRSPRESCSTCTWPASTSATPSSTRSSRWTPSAPARPRPTPTSDWRRGSRWVRCTGSRSRSRTPMRWAAGARRTAHR